MNDKYSFISSEERDPVCPWSVRNMCRWLEVSRSGYYEFKTRPASRSAERRAELAGLVAGVFHAFDGIYGHRRIGAHLRRAGVSVCDEQVRRLMAEQSLVACQPRPFRPTTTIRGRHSIPDRFGRDFTAQAPSTKLVGDITYIRTWEGWVYLATVLDCFSKKVVGYAMAHHMEASLVCDALKMAARRQGSIKDAYFHSDHGAQYSSKQFSKCAWRLGVKQSMGRTGVCWDNAWAESFNGTLKNERCNRTVYPTRRHAVIDVTNYIELMYNQRRLHSALGYRTPNEVEDAYWNMPLAA